MTVSRTRRSQTRLLQRHIISAATEKDEGARLAAAAYVCQSRASVRAVCVCIMGAEAEEEEEAEEAEEEEEEEVAGRRTQFNCQLGRNQKVLPVPH